MQQSPAPYLVCALYRFVDLPDYRELRQPLLNMLLAQDIRGTLLLAKEGINGTVSGTKNAIDSLLAYFDRDPRTANISHKISYGNEQPFYRTKVKLKKEIVTMGVEGLDPKHTVGTYISPQDWNQLLSDPDLLLIDTRNDYEVQLGTFKGAVNPKTQTFREFPAYTQEHLDPNKHKKIAMFCTGGIRCEKSTAYLKEQGFNEVYHLQGGILQYLEEIPEEESLWQGECFVFDNRVSVDHNLKRGHYDQCHACRLPITEKDKQHRHYVKGISCPYCYGKKDEKQIQRYQEREKQIELAIQRGSKHIGSEAKENSAARKQLKRQQKEADRQRETMQKN